MLTGTTCASPHRAVRLESPRTPGRRDVVHTPTTAAVGCSASLCQTGTSLDRCYIFSLCTILYVCFIRGIAFIYACVVRLGKTLYILDSCIYITYHVIPGNVRVVLSWTEYAQQRLSQISYCFDF